MKKQIGFFDEENRLDKISNLGDPLETLKRTINWEMFRAVLTHACRKENTGRGGRPPYDVVMMFKIIVLQRLYNLSDDQTEYQINDRMSFMRFLELNLCDAVPDAKTIWKFKNDLAEAGAMEELFCLFDKQLENEGIITHSGTIIDATFVDAPRQRNTRDENKKIKAGEVPEEWENPENAHKLAQKDTDARWTKKNNETHYGYKNHVKCDAESKIITNYSVTDAAVHDSLECVNLLEETDNALYADSAYSGAPIAEALPEGCENHICEKGSRNHPLTSEQKESNRKKSKIRCRIEHIFGFMTSSMKGISIRSVGITRAWFNIGLTNLVYNFCRYKFLKRNYA
ncbi:MAG: IS5 family transposase [bacterium]|nr:IS5 family transposase [bacterium]